MSQDRHVLLSSLCLVIAVCLRLAHASSTEGRMPTVVETNTTVGVNCSRIAAEAAVGTRRTIVLQSSTMYVLNCTEAQPAFLDFTSNGDGGDGDLHNVVVHATGGNILPRLNVVVAIPSSSGAPRSAISNVSLRMTNVHVAEEIVTDNEMFVVKGGRTIVGVSILLENVSLRLTSFDRLISMFIIGPPSASSSAPSAYRPSMSDVGFYLVSGSVVMLHLSRSSRALLLLVEQDGHNATSIQTIIRDSMLQCSGWADGYLILFHGDPDTAATIDGLWVAMCNASVRLAFLCPNNDPRMCYGDDVSQVIVRTAMISMDYHHLENVTMLVSGVAWTASTPDWPASDNRVSSMLCWSQIDGVSSRKFTVHIANSSFAASSSEAAAMIFLRVVECVELDVLVRHVAANITAWGAIVFYRLARQSSIIHMGESILINATVAVEHTNTSQLTQSGFNVASSVASSLAIAMSNLVLLSGGSRNLSVSVIGCTVHASVRGGTMPILLGVMSSFSLVASLILMRVSSHVMLTVRIDGSTLHTNMGCSVNAGATYVTLASVSAALVATANCSDCHIDIADTHAEIVAASFDQLPPSAISSAAIQHVNVYNIAAVYCAVEPTSILRLALPADLFNLIRSFQSALSSAVWHQRTHTHLLNASAALTASSRTLLVDDSNRLVQHVVAVATIPTTLTDSTMRIVNTSSSPSRGQQQVTHSAAASAEDGVRLTAPLLLSFTTTAVVRSDVTSVACRSVSLLLLALAGDVRLDDSVVTVERCVVARPRAASIPSALLPPLVAVAPYGTLQDGTTFHIDAADGATLSIRNSQFNHLEALVDNTHTMLGALALGCNLWDGSALPLAAIGVPLERVAYPRGTFDGDKDMSGVVCKGIQTQTHSVSLELNAPTISVHTAASTVASVATFASALGRILPRAAVGAVQGALGLQRLLAACRTPGPPVNSDNTEGEGTDGAAAIDNPLQLSLDVDASQPELRYVAGAVVGNTVFVFVVGAALHVCARASHHIEGSLTKEPTLRQHLVLGLLPTTLWPGCLLVPLGILLEPVARMAVLLMALGSVSVGALGVVVLIVWLTVVGFVAYRLLRVRPFPMRGVATRTITRRSAPAPDGGRFRRALCVMVRWTTEPTESFAPPKGLQHREYAALLEAHYACAYEPYKAPYVAFFVVEYGSVVLVGLLLGAASSVDPSSACDALQWCGWLVAVLFLCVAAAVVWLRPFSVSSDTISIAAIQGLCAASAIAAVLSSDSTDDTAEDLALAASCVELLAVVVGIAGQVANARLRRSVCQWSATTARLQAHSLSPRAHVGLRRREALRGVVVPCAPAAVEMPASVDAIAALGALLRVICDERRAAPHDDEPPTAR